MSNRMKSYPVRVMLCWTIAFAVLAFAAWFGADVIADYSATRLDKMQAEVDEYNAKQDQAYALALSEYEQAKSAGTNLAWPTPDNEGWDVVDLTNYPLENLGTVTTTRSDVMNGGLLLLNEWHARPDDFSEEGIVSVGNYTSWNVPVKDATISLFPVVIDALQAAINDAKALGFTDYMVQEGYRSWETQNTYFQNRVQQLQDRYSGDALIAQARKSVSYPGTSDYNSGMSFQLRLYNREDVNVGKQEYYTSAAGQWMSENCWKYGLVFRFPLEDYPLEGTLSKAYKTGISIDLDSYRYVGKGNAAAMKALGDLCLEEYLEYLQEHPHIAVFENVVLRYEIYRQVVGDAETFALAVNTRVGNRESSLDNMGGVVTVFSH